MGDVLEALFPRPNRGGWFVGSAWLGYVLTGGMGPLSRQVGLAVDQVLEIHGVWGDAAPLPCLGLTMPVRWSGEASAVQPRFWGW